MKVVAHSTQLTKPGYLSAISSLYEGSSPLYAANYSQDTCLQLAAYLKVVAHSTQLTKPGYLSAISSLYEGSSPLYAAN
jgi:hypothetical protein